MIPGLAGVPGFDEDDEEQKRLKGLGGSIGEQMGAPAMPPSPPPAPAPETLPVDPQFLPPAPPPAPQIAPYQPAPAAPIPPSRTVTPAEAANLGALDANAKASMATAQQAGDIEKQKAESVAIAADENADRSNNYIATRDKIQADADKRIAERQKQADLDYQKYREFGIKDPEADQSFGQKLLAGIAVALGAYAQGIQGGENHALAIIQKANADNIAKQKADQDKLFRIAEKSGQDVEEARKQRDDAYKQLDLKQAALLENSNDILKAQLARMGVPEAQIAANKDVQGLEQDGLRLKEHNLRDIAQDETALARAAITAAAKKAKAGAGGGGASGDAMAQLSQHLIDNPGDVPGAFALAEKLGLKGKAAQKAVDDASKLTKGTESQNKDASQGAVALRAIDGIEKSGFTPSRDDIQKWIANQRDVARAQQMSEGKGITGALSGGLANLAQSRGLLAQNEFDGLSPKAKAYFTDVRRYMETIGRVQSGAAISNSEWNNFYGQYGPQSEGGLEAAKQFAKDKFRTGGVAGRALSADGSVPGEGKGAASAAPAATAGANPKVALARQAIADPKASPGVKARALQILQAAGER